ncbi:MAG: DUF2203 family protein [Candidatus Aenigmatarchaeota archaeon]
MDGTRSEIRTWSLEEANKIIPIVAKAFDGIFALNEQIDALGKDMAVLYDIWGMQLAEPANPDYAYYRELRLRRAALQQAVERAVSELKQMGCAVDDLKRGIVHFYHKTERGIIVFCWRYGEQRISHWHEVSWRANRKRIGLKERV